MGFNSGFKGLNSSKRKKRKFFRLAGRKQEAKRLPR